MERGEKFLGCWVGSAFDYGGVAVGRGLSEEEKVVLLVRVDAKEPVALFRPMVCERDTGERQRFRSRESGLLGVQWGVEDNQKDP